MYKSPSLLFDQDLVVNFVTYTRVYTVFNFLAYPFQLLNHTAIIVLVSLGGIPESSSVCCNRFYIGFVCLSVFYCAYDLSPV